MLLWFPLLLAILVTALGVGYRVPALLWTGALLSLPAALYFAATPRFGLAALLPPLCLSAGAVALRRRVTAGAGS